MPGQKFKGKNGYVPRGERYNNLLDTAYADIVEKRKRTPLSPRLSHIRKGERKGERLISTPDQMASDGNKTPAVS